MRKVSGFFFSLLIAAALTAQEQPTSAYLESFRKGATHVTEESFQVKLTPADPTYRERIKDSAGNDRYELTITPAGPEGNTKITSWRVQLRDLRHSIYTNVLVGGPGAAQDPKNDLWWLNPNQFGAVPIKTKRIIKVDQFYVVIQVKSMHFTPLDSPYLDTMVAQFGFTNSDPRAGK